MDSPDFHKFSTALRAGDERAAAEFVRRYEPYLRHVIRLRLTDPHLRRVFDSLDVCQSVLGEFFVRLADGRFQFQDPARLRALLVKMAVNKLIDLARHESRHGGGWPESFDVPSPAPGAEELALRRDLARAVRSRLSDRERRVVDHRSLGRSWTEIAALDGGDSDALRVMYARALARVRREYAEECCRVP
jgi:RNA polymerase sigma factor (sigma-70 family)